MAAARDRTALGPPPSLAPAVKRPIRGRQYAVWLRDGRTLFVDESNDGTSFEPDISQYLPLLTPRMTKAGTVAKRQPDVPQRPSRWWKAQCGFRGLPVGGSIAELQERLRTTPQSGLCEMMKDARNVMSDELSRNNEAMVEETWRTASDKEKANLWPRRLLYETFSDSRVPPHSRARSLVVEVDSWGEPMKKTCDALGYCCELRNLPVHVQGQRLAIIGRSRDEINDKVVEAERNVAREKARAAAERERKDAEKSRKFQKALESAQSEKRSSQSPWNVTGRWHVDCPYIQEQWEDSGPGYSLQIECTKPDDNGLVQIYADFDFGILTGIMRLVNPFADADSAATGGEGEDEHGDSVFSEVYSDDEDELEESPSSEFLFPPDRLPSSQSREFNFRWRGEETGEGVIELGSDRHLCDIRFESSNVLSGTLTSSLGANIEFTGLKTRVRGAAPGQIGPGRGSSVYGQSPAESWASRSEAAYERARVGRWR